VNGLAFLRNPNEEANPRELMSKKKPNAEIYEPTRGEIREACREIRLGWDEAEYGHRRYGISRSEARKLDRWCAPVVELPADVHELIGG